MNIALIGHGKMGKEIERIAVERNITVKRILTRENNRQDSGLTNRELKGVDVCIDFSSPDSVMHNIEAAGESAKNIVVGTTGWYDKLDQVKKLVKAKKIGLLYSPNFSLGMNIFSQV